MKNSQVTTRNGDSGTTRTLAGDVLAKSHAVLECTGWVDSLRAQTAYIRLLILEKKSRDHAEVADFLLWLLHVYFLMGSAVNDPLNKHPEYRKGEIGPEHLERLEAEQRRLEKLIRLPKSFIVSASNLVSAQTDVTATVARTLERNLVRLQEAIPGFEAAAMLSFCNRLSDYLYILARYLEEGHHLVVDYDIVTEPGK